MGQDMLSAFCPCVSSLNFNYSISSTPLAILALLRARGHDATNLASHHVGALPRVRQSGGQRLSSSEPSPVLCPCPRCFTVRRGWDRDHVVHVGLMFEAVEAPGETYIGSAGSAVAPVVLAGLEVLARKPLYAFCNWSPHLHTRSFTA